MLKFFKLFFKHEETVDEMRERINRELREYNKTGIASIKFYKGAWYEWWNDRYVFRGWS